MTEIIKERKDIWFRRKLYGWGWTPCTWQGWVTILVWLAVYILGLTQAEKNTTMSVIVMVASIAILLVICYIKGESPKWQWGKRK